ncbi:MAG TPA: chromosome segregation protein SMC, partial [Polyangiaceae bacterium]|nr:chromosome segregation protein SMC [Polyangiaceae bacterium]
MATRLKRFDIQGFKSFATPTSFVFDTGITAVIGPNGSGKSNISDALRWVLGEQSYSNLRGRRTEDIIFAGSSARSPLGMAEVTVTLNNEDGSLPLAFSEISVTRRAYRNGENQYLINGARVRLKDVLHVTASLGQSYTVIGQGLVDAVLSQKADERRGLFEHAAGITGLRLKHAEAARNLSESQANCNRLEDLLADVEPRLRALERAARQAREYDAVKRQLRLALEQYYAFHWRQSEQRLASASVAAESAAEALDSALKQRDERRLALTRARSIAQERGESVETRRVEIDRLRDEHQRIDHDLALLEGRRTASRDRCDDAVRTLQTLRSSIGELSGEDDALSRALTATKTEIAERERQVIELEAASAASRQQRARVESRIAEIEQARLASERHALAKDNRGALLQAQIEQLEAERSRIQDGAGERDRREAVMSAQRAEASDELVVLSERLTALRDELRSLDVEIASGAEERRRLLDGVAACEKQIVSTGTRFEALKRLEESGAGLFAGVKQVLDAARRMQLGGVLGTLSSLLVVPDELEAAIEAALGAHLQDLVVERWTDAERAIDHLKRTKAGRATFQPLDTVVHRGHGPVVRPTPGIRGIAAELIDVDTCARSIVNGLLGRTLVADDLDAARAALPQLAPGWSIVTLGGEIARSNGTVTGGSPVRESGALARVRELRDLPRELERWRAERERASADLHVFDEGLRALNERKVRIASTLEQTRDESKERTATVTRLARSLDELRHAAALGQDRIAKLDERQSAMQQEFAALASERANDELTIRQMDEEREQLRQALASARAEGEDDRLPAAQSDLTRLRERFGSLEGQRKRLEAQARRVREQSDAAERRVNELRRDIAQLEKAHAAATEGRARLAVLLEQAECEFADLKATHATMLDATGAAQQAVDRDEITCRDLERENDRLTLDVSRRRDELELTLERAARDLEVDQVAAQLESSETVASDDLPRVEREITRNRERLRRIGVAGEDAIEQFEQESERIAFLRKQLSDIRSATEALRTLMNELNRTMATAFDETFGEVARAFEATFTSLFGGGK